MVGFIDDATLVVVDQVSLFRVTPKDGKVTALYKNASQMQIKDVTLSPSGDIAFLVELGGGETGAFVLRNGATAPRKVTSFRDTYVVNIVGLN